MKTDTRKKSAFKKTEELLYNYKLFKVAIELNENTQKAQGIVNLIDNVLEALIDDEYIDLIPMIYFEKLSREECAAYFNVEPITITRNKNRLVNKLKNILFADDAIDEMYK